MKNLTLVAFICLFTISPKITAQSDSNPPWGTFGPEIKSSDREPLGDFLKATEEKKGDLREMKLLEVLKKYPTSRIPKFKAVSDVAWRLPFIVSGQPLEPLIYFEIAEAYFYPEEFLPDGGAKRDLLKAESYYKKILALNGSSYWASPSIESTFKMKARIYLLHCYGESGKNEEMCQTADQILNHDNQHYQITYYLISGESKAEALLTKYYFSKKISENKRSDILKEVLSNFPTAEFGAHGGQSFSYASWVFGILEDRVASEKNRNDLKRTLNKLLSVEKIKKKFGFYLYVLLGDATYAEAQEDKTSVAISRDIYKKSLDFKSPIADTELKESGFIDFINGKTDQFSSPSRNKLIFGGNEWY